MLIHRHINIISCCGTAIENVAKWVEVDLRHLAEIHPTYIEDTRHFLERIEQINEKYAPLPPTTLLISWDIENFYPSCDTEKVIQAARKRLEGRVSKIPPTECITEAIKILMSSNNCEFQEEHYTYINGATIGGPESASTTGIFRAVFIDEPALNPIQAGVFWNHIGWGGTLCPPPFLLYLLSNYHQTWHASTMAQNLSKTVIVKCIVTSL